MFSRENAKFGPKEEIDAAIKTLEAKLEEVAVTFRDRNKLAMSHILIAFATPMTFAIAFYFVDWVSDWVCDSWLSFCVTASTVMAMYYTIVFVALLGYIAMKWKDYGPHGIYAALAPLAAKVSANFEATVTKVQTTFQRITGKGGASKQDSDNKEKKD